MAGFKNRTVDSERERERPESRWHHKLPKQHTAKNGQGPLKNNRLQQRWLPPCRRWFTASPSDPMTHGQVAASGGASCETLPRFFRLNRPQSCATTSSDSGCAACSAGPGSGVGRQHWSQQSPHGPHWWSCGEDFTTHMCQHESDQPLFCLHSSSVGWPHRLRPCLCRRGKLPLIPPVGARCNNTQCVYRFNKAVWLYSPPPPCLPVCRAGVWNACISARCFSLGDTGWFWY